MSKMTFGEAFQAAKTQGVKIAREGWNGKGMFVYYVPAATYPAATGVAKQHFPDGQVPYRAYLALKDVSGTVGPWIPSMTDIDSEDWGIVAEQQPDLDSPTDSLRTVLLKDLDATGRAIFGGWWITGNPIGTTRIPILRDAGERYREFMAAVKATGVVVPDTGNDPYRTLEEIANAVLSQ